ncbi:hypothetical protein D3C72_1962300 [compost metagenome]
MGGDGNRIETVLLAEPLKGGENEAPEHFHIVMRINSIAKDRVRLFLGSNLLSAAGVDDDDLGIGLADIDDRDTARFDAVGHGRWNTVTRSFAMGELSGLLSMMSAICAHHFFITGWSGSAAMPWFFGRVSTPKRMLVSGSRWME